MDWSLGKLFGIDRIDDFFDLIFSQWIGFLILGTLILLFTFPMFLFPKTFTKKEPITTTAEKNSDSKNQTDNDKALTTTTPTPAPTSENISNIQGLLNKIIEMDIMIRFIIRLIRCTKSFCTIFKKFITYLSYL